MSTFSTSVTIAGFQFPNPIFVASGTFGYAEEMESLVDLSRLGAIIPKTVTLAPRAGNRTPRTCETASGMLNAIGLDNDGIDAFLANKLPQLAQYGAPIVISIAAKSPEECAPLGEKLAAIFSASSSEISRKLAAVELNISCPNVSGGVDFATEPALCEKMVTAMRKAISLPLWVKLSPNVTQIAAIAQAAENGGADAICAINTCLGLAVDWRKREARLSNGFGGLSGPAIKPIALRCVHQIFRAVSIPVIGIGGIAAIDDVLEFLVAGATAVQIGTANFYSPYVTMEILDSLPQTLQAAKISSCRELVGTLKTW